MARIIVTPDEQSDLVLLDENVYPVHLDNELSSRQVAERLAWAVSDAEAAERRQRLLQTYPEQPLHA
jgi:D-serine deaminase-like pyridoxal phosphate-dependent protein